jgi:hypothetical protein
MSAVRNVFQTSGRNWQTAAVVVGPAFLQNSVGGLTNGLPAKNLPRAVCRRTHFYPTVSPCRASADVERIARSIYGTLDADKEHFALLTLNNKNRVNGFKVVSTGSVTASIVHPREVWRAALHLCAAAVIFVHNHPSGDPAPSQEDQEITRRLKETGDMLGAAKHEPLARRSGACSLATLSL